MSDNIEAIVSRPSSSGRVRGLRTRMLQTALLLALLYVVLIAVLVAAGVGAVAVAVIAGLLFLIQYSMSGRLALSALGAHPVGRDHSPQLHATIRELCVEADLPLPRVAVIETPMPNACTIGRSGGSVTVCVTTGLLDTLEPEELEAVLAHELSHVCDHDVTLMTLGSLFASVAAFIAMWGGGGSRDDDRPGLAVVAIASGLVYVVSYVLLQGLSRYREVPADRGAARLTGRPAALIAALVKISDRIEVIPQRDLRAADGALAAFYILPPMVRRSVASLFSTHPPLEARIAALQRLDAVEDPSRTSAQPAA